MSRLFGTTLREAPSGVQSPGSALLARAGFIRQAGPGALAWLPLARRSLARIESALRQEMEAVGGQELALPQGLPPDQAAGLCASVVRSWRQLPALVYQIRSEGPLLEAYTFDADPAGLAARYQACHAAICSVLARCAIPVTEAIAGPDPMSAGSTCTLFSPSPAGEESMTCCDSCGYKAEPDLSRFARTPGPDEDPLPLEKVATPSCTTIEGLASLLGVPRSRTAKAVFLVARTGGGPAAERFVFAVVRGDRDVSEAKLAESLGADELRPATEEEIRATGAVPGSASPLGLSGRVLVVVDEEAARSPNLVAGANEEGFHLRNTNIPRDYLPNMVCDIARARDGDGCPVCGRPLGTVKAVRMGTLRMLGTRWSDPADAVFQDREGREKPVLMGSYQIHIDRILARVAEGHRDGQGLCWPAPVAPCDVHLVTLGGAGTEAGDAAESLYRGLREAGVDVLFDDREESPGVKFKDADLIGIPLRFTVSARSLKAGGVEMKLRGSEEKEIVAVGECAARARAGIA